MRMQMLFKKLLYHASDCRSVEFSADSRWLASASFDSTIGFVSLQEQNQVFQLRAHSDRVVSAKWHQTLPILISTSADKSARVFTI
jgi:WD40 repeat protein